MRKTLTLLLAPVAFASALTVVHATRATAQRPSRSPSDTLVVGVYDFWFTPSNNEPVSGRVVLSRRLGRYTAIVTSPKLSDPEPADSVSVTNGTVFLAFFGGQFTFTFHVSGATISDGRFTKSMRGVTEQGRLDLTRATP